jgi:hypothetical protein
MRPSYKILQESVNVDSLISNLRTRFDKFIDKRAKNSSVSLTDILISGYAIFSLKYSSLLQFELQNKIERENLLNLFSITKTCNDSQMRVVLDEVDPDDLRSFYPENFKELERLGITKEYEFWKKYLVVAIDGVSYFESKKIHCDCCLEKKHKDGTISYNHSMLCAMLVNPQEKEVFVMGTEPIVCQDGTEKNDCERNASKRLLTWMSGHYKNKKLLITEDALYSNAPNIEQIGKNGWSYVLGIKPDGNKSLFKAFDEKTPHPRVKHFSYSEDKIKYEYSYLNNIALNSSNPNIRVNVLVCKITDKKGKKTQFSWVTDIDLNHKTLKEVMLIGRSRWKIENETFNTLKNQGYHFEHNYGHGKKHLSTVLSYLMLLAFHNDQLLQRCNKTFICVWQMTKSKLRLWETLRSLFTVKPFQNFKELYDYMAFMYQVKIE